MCFNWLFKKKENKCCANCKWCGLNSKIYTGSRCTLWNRYTLIDDIDEIHNNKGLIYDWHCKDWSKKEMEKENVNITEVLKNLSYKDDNIFRYKDILFTFIKEDLKIIVHVMYTNMWELKNTFSIYDRIDELTKYLSGISKQCNFFDTIEYYMPIKYIMKEGEYWKMNKEMNTIDSCDNKDKVCKSRAECMAEIVEQNKFDIEEEFKNICIKERETILENIHKAIEEEAKLANRKIEFSLFKYMTKDFNVIDYHSDFYNNTGYESENIKFRNHHYWPMDIRHHYLTEILNDYKSYVWKFVDKLDYDTAKRMCQRYVYDWIISVLNDEGFRAGFFCKEHDYGEKYDRISVEW